MTDGVPDSINSGDRLPSLGRSQVKMEYGDEFVQHSDTYTKLCFQFGFLIRMKETDLTY
jgi:hypothetical protein